MKKFLTVLLSLILLGSTLSALAETWTCPSCGREGNDGNFCPTCATAKPEPKLICPGCGAEYDSDVDYIYCPNCAAPLRQETRKSVSIGDVVTFGTYPQTAEGTDQTPIEWIVLDAQDGKALLLSKYGLETKPYNTKYTDVTWETCSLRSWLNSFFLNAAFSEEEQSAILTTAVDNSASQGYSGWNTNGGNNTQDQIFLLSYAEANLYLGVMLGDDNNIKSRVAPTEYAIMNHAWTNDSQKTADGKPAGWWWLRSPGYSQQEATYVYDSGSLYSPGVNAGMGVVRPAFWLNLESGIF